MFDFSLLYLIVLELMLGLVLVFCWLAGVHRGLLVLDVSVCVV